MSKRTLAEMTRQYLEIERSAPSIAWQGGEPTLIGLDFFRKAVEFQACFSGPGQRVVNSLQTNGTLITEEWARFLADGGFLVGLSIDGPAVLHDEYRFTKGGRGSHHRVLRGLRLMQDAGVEFNALIALNATTIKRWREVYDYIHDLGVRHFQFIPVVEPVPGGDEIAPFSVTPREYGEYLIGMFDLWKADGAPNTYVRDFDEWALRFAGFGHPSCIHRERCLDYVVVEGNGDVYTCDWTVVPEWKLGNLHQKHMQKLVQTARATEFADEKSNLAEACVNCDYVHYCQGGCPVHRRIAASDGEPSPSYFCEGYKMFFSSRFDEMTELVRRTTKLRGISHNPPPLGGLVESASASGRAGAGPAA
jgi:uncharacterized protein